MSSAIGIPNIPKFRKLQEPSPMPALTLPTQVQHELRDFEVFFLGFGWRAPSPRLGGDTRKTSVSYVFRFSASKTFSDVIGSEVMRTPQASATALAMAPAVGMLAVSPMAMLL